MNTRAVNSAAGVILAAMRQHRTAAGIALALESAGLLMTPEAAKDLASVSTEAVRVAEEALQELRREHEESARLRARVAELEAERHSTNDALAGITVDLRTVESLPAQGEMGTLPAWLYHRFVPVAGAPAWESLTDGDRAYWVHQARAVRRAVTRDGFKAPTQTLREDEEMRSCCAGPVCTCTPSSPQDDEYIPPRSDVTPQVQKLRNLLAGQREALEGEHYASVHHTYRLGHDLPPLGGVS